MLDFTTRMGPMMDQICPFHVAFGGEGDVIRMGPSFPKIAPHFSNQEACSFWDPDGPITLKAMTERPVRNLRVHVGGADDVHLVGQSFPVFDGAWLFLGPTLEEITKRRDSGFRRDDFPAQMLIEDILFLIEAKSVVLAASEDITARLQHEKSQAEHRALSDTLTGLGNRHAYDHFLETEGVCKMGRCAMHLDLDKFKAVNDTLGHAAGDFVLQHVARLLLDVTRREDEVIRMGGDEFIVILAGIRDRINAEEIAERILARSHEPIDFRGARCEFGVSIGMAWQNDHRSASLSQLTEMADKALYKAKENGRGQFKWYLGAMPSQVKTSGAENKSDPQFLQKPDQYTPIANASTGPG